MQYISFGCKDTHFAENLKIYFVKNAENLKILSIVAENLTIYFVKYAENLKISPPIKLFLSYFFSLLFDIQALFVRSGVSW